MDYKRNIKFFKAKKSLTMPIVLIVIGVLLLPFIIGIVPLAIGIIMIVMNTGRPKETEIDEQAVNFGKDIKNYALKKMSLEEEQLVADPIIFWGYDLGKPVLSDPVIEKEQLVDMRGPDGKWRSPHVAINVIFFTENEIHSLRRYVSLVSEAFNDKKDEFAYKHVAGISSDTEEYIRPNTNVKIHSNVVVLRSGGERFPFYSIDSETAERAESALKTIWRQKNA